MQEAITVAWIFIPVTFQSGTDLVDQRSEPSRALGAGRRWGARPIRLLRRLGQADRRHGDRRL